MKNTHVYLVSIHVNLISQLFGCDRFRPQLRLGDTDLIIQVEKDFTIYGDECKFGGGKGETLHTSYANFKKIKFKKLKLKNNKKFKNKKLKKKIKFKFN